MTKVFQIVFANFLHIHLCSFCQSALNGSPVEIQMRLQSSLIQMDNVKCNDISSQSMMKALAQFFWMKIGLQRPHSMQFHKIRITVGKENNFAY
jgi:hypothetical protein